MVSLRYQHGLYPVRYTQVRTCQRLGYMNVFNPRRPAMHYRLRMFKVWGHGFVFRRFGGLGRALSLGRK